MADDEPDVITQFETQSTAQDRRADTTMRSVLSDTYVFVRSAEVNKTISSFTFDHYIQEAKNALKVDRILKSASNPAVGVGSRQAIITALETLETNFNNSLDSMKKLAQAKDAKARGSA
jgi:hypothetical protein